MSNTRFQTSIEKFGREGRRAIRIENGNSDFVEVDIFQAVDKELDGLWFSNVEAVLSADKQVWGSWPHADRLEAEIHSKINTGPHSSMSVTDDAEIIGIMSATLKTALGA